MLTIASSKLCECKNNYYIPLAAGVEFMHTATLLHDDVVDDSEMRRGVDREQECFGKRGERACW